MSIRSVNKTWKYLQLNIYFLPSTEYILYIVCTNDVLAVRYDVIYDPFPLNSRYLKMWGVDSPAWDKTSIWYLLESCTKNCSSYNISSLCLYKIINTIWLKVDKEKDCGMIFFDTRC